MHNLIPLRKEGSLPDCNPLQCQQCRGCDQIEPIHVSITWQKGECESMTEKSFLEIISDLSDECAYSGVTITPDIRSSFPQTMPGPGCFSINGMVIEELVPGYQNDGYIDRELLRTAIFNALDQRSRNLHAPQGDASQ